MKRSKSIVNIHIILGAICSLPILLTAITGIFLIVRSHTTFMQPQASKARVVANLDQLISPQKIVGTAQILEGVLILLSINPKKGLPKLEPAMDLSTILMQHRKLLNSGAKRTSFFIRLHEGSYFGAAVRDFVFLPSALIFLISLLTGIYLTFFGLKGSLWLNTKDN